MRSSRHSSGSAGAPSKATRPSTGWSGRQRVARVELDAIGAGDELQVVVADHCEPPAVARVVVLVRERVTEVGVAQEGRRAEQHAEREADGSPHAVRRAARATSAT
jgi:hypothetical protein